MIKLLLNNKIANYENINFGFQKAAYCIFGCTHNWLNFNVETSVNQHPVASFFFKALQQFSIPGVTISIYGLYTSRIIHVCHRGDIGSYLPKPCH